MECMLSKEDKEKIIELTKELGDLLVGLDDSCIPFREHVKWKTLRDAVFGFRGTTLLENSCGEKTAIFDDNIRP